jgi:capsular polysaccharide transport system permease protein
MKIHRKSLWVYAVLLPFFLSCCYFGFIATNRYVGEARVIVKQSDNKGGSDYGLSLLGAAMTPSSLDAQLISEFVLSLDMLHHLESTIDLRKHYQSSDADLLSRLWKGASQEAFLAYFRNHTSASFSETSGILTIRAEAFTPKYAQIIVEEILQHSEQFINQISHKLATEQVDFVQIELTRAAQHLRTSKQKILEFQEKHQLFSPEQESGAKLKMVNELEAELTRHKAELNNLRSYMNDSAAEVLTLRAKLESLENQLQIERKKLVGNESYNFSDVNAKYADLQLDLTFSTDLYKASLMSLEQARIEAYRKLKHLVVVDSPSLPEEAEFPRRIYNVISILVVLLLGYGALSITLATIREHRDA